MKINKQQKGSVLVSVLIVLPFLILIALNYTSLATNNITLSQKDTFRTKTQLTADAGLDYGMHQITLDPNWTGTSGPVDFYNNAGVKTTYEVTITDVSSNKKIMSSESKLFRPTTSTTPQTTVKINAELKKVSSGNYSIVTGVGGLTMVNSSKVLGGDVYVNGAISMANTAQIGLQSNPINLKVAHQNCPNPPDATYPRVCNSGENGEPISLSNSAHIYGTVRANNQTNGSGMSDPGLTFGPAVAPLPLPAHDRNAQKAAVSNNLTGSAASCTTNNGSVTWPANVKITGNVTISKKCTVTMNGNAWITGTLHLTQSGTIIPSNSLGTTRADLMIDGANTSGNTPVTFENSSGVDNNSSGTGIQLINYSSTASCSPDCADVTGTDLKNSRNIETISLDNTGSGSGTIFYSKWTKVTISNSGQIGALIGQTVNLQNTATITFGTQAGFSTYYWIIDGYRRAY